MLSRVGGERGAAAVEFALLMPLLLLFVFGIIDFGRMYNAQITATEAAREAARVAALGDTPTVADLQARVDEGFDGYTVVAGSTTLCPAAPEADDDAEVTVTHDFTFVTPVAALVGIEPITITGIGVMPCRS